MSEDAVNERLEVANRIAKSAGQIARKYFRTDQFSVDYKDDGSPLTIADRESEAHLREQIELAFPDDAIVGEEFADKAGRSGFGWILDPIDGTKSFIAGVPLFGTMVAVEETTNNESSAEPAERNAVIGSVYFPGLDEGVYAARGQGAFSFQGDSPPVAAQVSNKSELDKSVLVTTCVPTFAERGASEVYAALAEKFYFTRTWGDVYGYFLVATGRAEVMIDPILSVWDAAAVQPIIVEAGGRFSDWKGRSNIDGGDAVGSNGVIHDTVLDFLNR
ncbi:MAG: inositol monophosphatase family protein [Planctomycetota bacterium]